MENQNTLLNLIYLISIILFIRGLKGLSHPKTAVKGNLLGSLGMLTAILATLFKENVISYELILAGFLLGSSISIWLAIKIQMTSMPELVALFNGFGGLASVLVAATAIIHNPPNPHLQISLSIISSGIIGSVTFFGSAIAFFKLYGLSFFAKKSFRYQNEHTVKILLLIISSSLAILLLLNPQNLQYYWLLIASSAILGILLVIPIGGADMPVVIALLNSYSGIAAAATGFIVSNQVLIVSGSLVGASGIILTQLMCKAMNRSLKNVMFGGFGQTAQSQTSDSMYEGKIKSVSPEDVAIFLDSSQKVIIVPGYGMAVGQAQQAIKDLTDLLETRDILVEFAIHPVAGRMPGHMNVLLADVNIPYEKLVEMDHINPNLSQFDLAIVLGANDVVNPDARNNPQSPIAGMPIINVDYAKNVIVIKRSLSPGFAGIPNPLFTFDHTFMFFSDGKKAVLDIISAIKSS